LITSIYKVFFFNLNYITKLKYKLQIIKNNVIIIYLHNIKDNKNIYENTKNDNNRKLNEI